MKTQNLFVHAIARASLAMALVIAVGALSAALYTDAGATPSRVFLDAQGLPLPPQDAYPVRCEAPYLLAPGERAIVACVAYNHRVAVDGSVTLQSGHESVDVALVRRLALGRVVLSVTNHSAEPVDGAATVEIY